MIEKDKLQIIVDEMCHNLSQKIDLNSDIDKDTIINFLYDAATVILNIDDEKVKDLKYAKSVFNDSYKDIADKSLSAYTQTNDRFERLTQLHEETLNRFNEPKIDLTTITNKFNDIQSHMTQEVQKANEVIAQLTKQVKDLEDTSNLDSLTKVFNRRALTNYLNDLCNVKNIKYEFHLLIIDIDDFKSINDKYGHIAGDKILIYIANILRKTLRDGDKVFRYGGEEFVITLNRINEVSCKRIGERLLELIRSNKLIYKGESIHVTASMGATKFKSTDTPDSLIARADKALYKAKNTGKNKMLSEI